MPFTPFKVDLKGEYSPKNISRRDDSRRHKDSHNLSLHKADRYDQHYHPSNSGNVTKSSTVNKDESDRSVVNKTSDKSYNVTITNSHVHLPSSGLPTTSTGQTSQPIISLSDPTNCVDEESLKQIQDSLEEATKTSVEAAKICSDLVEEYRNEMEEICSGPNVNLIVKHEELQSKAIEKFYELMKEVKNEQIQTDFLFFITQKTDEIFSTYDAKNKRNVINALGMVFDY
ncbi:hypothetical protein B566_EDAN017291 [Ephemera danica]|nr:hypothetical protein B566_EDAN017291 [Ephemera danica]